MKIKSFTCALFLSLTTNSALALDLSGADGLVDFDSAVGFSTPRTISVFRSADNQDHLYMIVPNSVKLASNSVGLPEFSLIHKGWSAEVEGYISFSLQPVIDTVDLAAVIADIKTLDPNAVFGVPQPIESTFYIVGPNMPLRVLAKEQASGNPLLTKSSFSVSVSSIAVRASILPASYKMPIFSVGHDFILKGITREKDGKLVVTERRFGTSLVLNGLCAVYPALVVDLNSNLNGCRRIPYPSKLITGIQRQLKLKAYEVGPVDGKFGPKTELALRQYQEKSNMIVDGVPTLEIFVALGGTY